MEVHPPQSRSKSSSTHNQSDFHKYEFCARVIPSETEGRAWESFAEIAASQTSIPRLAERDPAPQDNDECETRNK